MEYHSRLAGVYLEEWQTGNICSLQIAISSFDAEQVFEKLGSGILPYNSILVGVDYPVDHLQGRLTFASSALCQNHDANPFSKFFAIDLKRITSLQLLRFVPVDTMEVLHRRGLDNVDASAVVPHDSCYYVRKRLNNLSLEDIMSLRYKFGVPILYYGFNESNEILAFEAPCGSVMSHISMIDYLEARHFLRSDS
jgi:hypothetical protein